MQKHECRDYVIESDLNGYDNHSFNKNEDIVRPALIVKMQNLAEMSKSFYLKKLKVTLIDGRNINSLTLLKKLTSISSIRHYAQCVIL